MKEVLKYQLETYKKYNTRSSKEDMLATMDAITISMEDNASLSSSSIEEAKKALAASKGNKDEIVQAVESVISNLN